MLGQPHLPLEPQSIDCSLLNTCGTKHPVVLAKFVAELDFCRQNLKRACTTRALTPDLTRAYAQTASNIGVVASCMKEAQSDIESILSDFFRRLDLSVPATTNNQDASASSFDSHSETPHPATSASSSSSNAPQRALVDRSQDILKKWSNQHLSYLFPSKEEVIDLASQTRLSETQVNLWFRNARTRSGWSKLYGNKLYANKDRRKLQSYFDEYDIIRNLHGSKAGTTSGLDGVQVLVEKIHTWFRVKGDMRSNSTGSSPTSSVCAKSDEGLIRPWVKDVLFGTLAALRSTSLLSSSPAKKPSYLASSSCSDFDCAESDVIDPSLRSSSPESVCDTTQRPPRSACTSSTWSSISPTSSRSTSPSASSSGPPLTSSACSPSSTCSTSPRSTMQCLSFPSFSPQMTSPIEISRAISYPSYTISQELQSDLPSSIPPVSSSDMVAPLPPTHESSDIPPASSSPVPLDPRLDVPMPLLSFFSSDTFSPPSPTHEPCSVTSGQFDDAEED